MRVPADHRHLTMLRGLTETALLLADFALDEVTDLQVAIDEITTGLVEVAVDGCTIDCDLTVEAGRITVCISTMAVHPGCHRRERVRLARDPHGDRHSDHGYRFL